MSETTIETRVKRVIAEQLGLADDAVANDKSLIADYGADSLDLVELVMALEDEFCIEIEDDDANKAATVQDVITLVTNRKPS